MNPLASLINRLNAVFRTIGRDIGDLEQLQTADTWSVVRAINELVSRTAALEAGGGVIHDTGVSTSQTWSSNQIVQVLSSALGISADLTTNDKSNIVAAINEVNSKIDALTVRVAALEAN